MTRKEAKDILGTGFNDAYINGFMKAHNDFESQTCENCKLLVDGSCTLGIRHFEIDTNPEDFGCRPHWEPKDSPNK